MNRQRILLIVLGLAALTLVWSRTSISIQPGYKKDDLKATAAAIEKFHARMNASQFDAIYDDANQLFQKSQERRTIIQAMGDTRKQFGKFERTTFSRLNVIVGTPIQIRAVYNGRFEKGDATEQFVFIKEGEDVKLAQYTVYSGTVRPPER
jgi:hypothetical protein